MICCFSVHLLAPREYFKNISEHWDQIHQTLKTATHPGYLGGVTWNIARYPWGIIPGSLILEFPLLLLHLLSQWSWGQFDLTLSLLWQTFKLHKKCSFFLFSSFVSHKRVQNLKITSTYWCINSHPTSPLCEWHTFSASVEVFHDSADSGILPLAQMMQKMSRSECQFRPFLIQAIIQHLRSAQVLKNLDLFIFSP